MTIVNRPPPWYLWLILFVTVIGGTVFAVKSGERSLDAERRSTREVVCLLAVTQDNVYRETPPTTAAGIRLAEEWRNLRERFACEE